MIHKFERSGIFFPRSWANSIASWISGICSPSDTIRIQNDMSPGEGASAKLDVNIDVVYDRLKERLDLDYVSRSKLNEIVDSKSLMVSSGIIQVNSEYVREVTRT